MGGVGSGPRMLTLDRAMVFADCKQGLSLENMASKYKVSLPVMRRERQQALDAFQSIPRTDQRLVGYSPAYRTGAAKVLGMRPPETPVAGEDHGWQPGLGVDEAIAQWRAYLGYQDGPPKPPKSKDKSYRKILLLNDIHAPYQRMDVVREALREDGKDADLLVIGGDLLDLFAVSRYTRFEQHFSLSEEFKAGKALLNLFAEKFPQVIVLPGNHDERWKKHLVGKRGMSPEELNMLNLLAEYGSGIKGVDVTDPLACLTYDLDNVIMAQPVYHGYARFSFFVQIGDLIVSHAEKFSRITGRAAGQAAAWFLSCGRAMNPPLVQPFKLLAQTHSHQFSWGYTDGGIWAMECGCCCETPDYAASPKLFGAGRPSVLGWSVFYQNEEGKTDVRRSRFVPFER